MLWVAATYKSEALRVINILMRATLASWKTTRSPDTYYKRNCIIGKLLSHCARVTSDRSGTPVPRNQPKSGFKASWTRLFFIFCQIFAFFDDFSKFGTTYGALYIEESSNLAKNEETHISMALPKSNTWVSGTRFVTMSRSENKAPNALSDNLFRQQQPNQQATQAAETTGAADCCGPPGGIQPLIPLI